MTVAGHGLAGGVGECSPGKTNRLTMRYGIRTVDSSTRARSIIFFASFHSVVFLFVFRSLFQCI